MSTIHTPPLTWTERRHRTRRATDGTHVHVHVLGAGTQRCKVRSMSSAGIFVETAATVQPGLRIELAYTCSYTRQIVKIYRRSAYVARVSDDGMALLFSDSNRAQFGTQLK